VKPSYLDTLNEKKILHAQTSKEQLEQAAMLQELKKMQLAALMGSQGKSTVILTDQTDLGDKLKSMVDSFTEAVKSSDTTSLNEDQIKELKALQSGLDKLTAAINASKPDNSAVIAAIKALKLDVAAPVINVPQAKVNVQPAAVNVDFKPLQDTIKEYFKTPEIEDEKIDLDCYRAQDLIDNGDVQYIGFVNPAGNWYIIENKVRENQMRYCFGSTGYAKAFSKAAQYEYSLLNEAIASATA
jgi:hypothetical protein